MTKVKVLHLQMSRKLPVGTAQCTIVALLLTMHAGKVGGGGARKQQIVGVYLQLSDLFFTSNRRLP